MNQEKTKQDETLMSNILNALGWNKINMAKALIGMDRANPEQIQELDQFLREHNGEITEDEYLAIVPQADPTVQTMTQDQKGMLVLNYLRSLEMESVAILDAICDENLEQSYKLITENPKISKADFLEKMQITED